MKQREIWAVTVAVSIGASRVHQTLCVTESPEFAAERAKTFEAQFRAVLQSAGKAGKDICDMLGVMGITVAVSPITQMEPGVIVPATSLSGIIAKG